MGKFSDIISGMGQKNKEKKELLKGALEQDRIQNIVEERKKSANQRELERYYKEDNEKQIKSELEFMRKKRDNDFNYGNQILKTPNVTKGSDFDILKTKKIFTNKNMLKQRRVY